MHLLQAIVERFYVKVADKQNDAVGFKTSFAVKPINSYKIATG